MSVLDKNDPEVAALIHKEEDRQRFGLELIPSENYASLAVMEAQRSVLMNKYSEGYPGKRYYGGNEFYDTIENLAIERLKKLFGAQYANVQPHSGAQANMAVYAALLQPGDPVLAMDLAHGGHLTHGSPVNFSGMLYKFSHYGVRRDNGLIDYEQVESLAKEHHPKLIVAGATAYPRHYDFKRFREIADSVGAKFMVDMAHFSGLVAGGAHPSPIPFADIVTSTTQKTLRGPRGGIILCKEELGKAIDKAVFPYMQGGPFMHTIAAKAVCFGEALQPGFRDYAQQIVKNTKALAEELLKRGFVLSSGGSDNHLLLVDLRPKKMTGKEAQLILDEARITLNKNMIPYDPEKPMVTSGVRLGTPAVTTRGMKEKEMHAIGGFIDDVISNPADALLRQRTADSVKQLCSKFRLPWEGA